jgi:hypothetical protein
VIERMVGLAVITGVLLLYVPDSERLSNRVVLPAIAVFGAWLAVKRLGVVALAVALLAAIHSAPGAADWVVGIFYPSMALLSFAVFAYLAAKRLRDQARATRDARWATRPPKEGRCRGE